MKYKPEAFEYWGDTLPKKIRMVKTVRADVPWVKAVACMGDEYEVFLNQYGAVSVKIGEEILGLKPNEFDVIERFRPTESRGV